MTVLPPARRPGRHWHPPGRDVPDGALVAAGLMWLGVLLLTLPLAWGLSLLARAVAAAAAAMRRLTRHALHRARVNGRGKNDQARGKR